ncbi:MAG: sialate O-acetylesterase, partial [Planctomycetaceae bacterium]|nr:sialate O-acetylesterase [Planctomycetaceae bacterium]
GADAVMGPIFRSASRDGSGFVIQFRNVDNPFPSPAEGVQGFAIAGPDHVFRWAHAKVEGNTVRVWHQDIAEPAAVRYSWAANPIGNLRNQAGLPASPFRTDDWNE